MTMDSQKADIAFFTLSKRLQGYELHPPAFLPAKAKDRCGEILIMHNDR